MRKIIVDCDPGMDDSSAIIMAVKNPNLDIQAVTTVNGNYPVDITYRNARRIMRMLGREDIPVYRGCSRPMVRDIPNDPFTHGRDGPGEITLVCLAPMTNIAMALRLAPDIKDKIVEVIAISGAFGLNEASFLNATGDTPQSEWNVYVDPEATKQVYESGLQVTAIGLDVATYFSVDFTDEDLARLAASDKPEAKFLHQAISFVHGRGFQAYCAVIDCMAVAATADPTLLKSVRGRVGVSTQDGLTLGMTIMDRRHHHVWTNLPEINVAVSADYARFLHGLIEDFLK